MKPFAILRGFLLLCCFCHAQQQPSLKVRIEWGHTAPQGKAFYVRPSLGAGGVSIESTRPVGLEAGEDGRSGVWQTRAGGGDVDGIEITLHRAARSSETLQNMQVIWADTIAAADPDTARRLLADASLKPASPRLTVQMNEEGTTGFTVTMDQLLTERVIWIPSLDIYITAGDDPVSFDKHQAELKQFSG